MGFVGFRSEADALAAVKRLHGTFIDTSRIVVEMAVPVGAPELQRPWSKHSKGSSAYTSAHPEEKKKPATTNNNNKPQETNANGKRKVDKNDPQLLEFLGLHQKVKKWENDDTIAESRDNKDEDDNKSKKRKTFEKEAEMVTAKKAKAEKVSDKVEKVEPIKNKSKKSTEATPEAVNKIVTKDEIHKDKVLQDEFGESDDEYEDLPDPTKQPLFLGEDEVEADGEGNDVPMEDGEEDDFDYIKSKMGQSKKVNEEKDESSSGDDSGESEEEEKPKKKKHSENGGKVTEADTGRLFVRNLPFTITEEEIRELFGKYGIISDVHVPVDRISNRPKGLALVQFMVASDASKAMRSLDSKSFQGRLLHVIPGEEQRNVEAMKKDVPIDEKGASSYKAKQMKEQKAKSTTAYNWNSLYIRSDAVVEAFCARNGVTKSEIYDPTQPHLAVQLALMETQTIMETKQYLERNGVNIDVLSSSVDKAVKRSNNVILIKNIPYESTSNELTTQFQKHGAVARVIVPPSRTVALIEFVNPNEAKSAFKGLAYRKYHGVPLYLEWAPVTVFDTPTPQALPTAPARTLYPSARPSTPPPSTPSTPAPRVALSVPAPTAPSTSASAPATTPSTSTSTSTRIPAPSKPITTPSKPAATPSKPAATPSKPATPVPSTPSQPAASEEVKAATLYVTNISFKTEDKDLISLFNKEEGYKNINIPKKLDKRGQPTLSSGNAFVNFETAQQAAKAREKLQGCAVDGFRLKIEFSMAKKEEARIPSTISAKMQPTTSAATLPGQSDAQGPTKLVVRNIPFEATQNELKALFQAVGGFKNARLPQKMDHKHRGFGFIEFLTHNEAKKALETMSSTHLYGRHLVLEFAKADRNLDEIRKKTAVDYARLTKAEGKEQPKWYEV